MAQSRTTGETLGPVVTLQRLLPASLLCPEELPGIASAGPQLCSFPMPPACTGACMNLGKTAVFQLLLMRPQRAPGPWAKSDLGAQTIICKIKFLLWLEGQPHCFLPSSSTHASSCSPMGGLREVTLTASFLLLLCLSGQDWFYSGGAENSFWICKWVGWGLGCAVQHAWDNCVCSSWKLTPRGFN